MLATEAKSAGTGIALRVPVKRFTAVIAGSVDVNEILATVDSFFGGSVVLFSVPRACKTLAVVKSFLVLISRPGVRKRPKSSVACPAWFGRSGRRFQYDDHLHAALAKRKKFFKPCARLVAEAFR